MGLNINRHTAMPEADLFPDIESQKNYRERAIKYAKKNVKRLEHKIGPLDPFTRALLTLYGENLSAFYNCIFDECFQFGFSTCSESLAILWLMRRERFLNSVPFYNQIIAVQSAANIKFDKRLADIVSNNLVTQLMATEPLDSQDAVSALSLILKNPDVLYVLYSRGIISAQQNFNPDSQSGFTQYLKGLDFGFDRFMQIADDIN